MEPVFEADRWLAERCLVADSSREWLQLLFVPSVSDKLPADSRAQIRFYWGSRAKLCSEVCDRLWSWKNYVIHNSVQTESRFLLLLRVWGVYGCWSIHGSCSQSSWTDWSQSRCHSDAVLFTFSISSRAAMQPIIAARPPWHCRRCPKNQLHAGTLHRPSTHSCGSHTGQQRHKLALSHTAMLGQ